MVICVAQSAPHRLFEEPRFGNDGRQVRAGNRCFAIDDGPSPQAAALAPVSIDRG